MNVFDRIGGRIKEWFRALAIDDPKAWNRSLWNLFGSQSLSGESVDEYSSLGSSPVYNAVSLIAGTIGALPLHLMQSKEGKKRIADDKKLYRVMHDEWNPWMTAMAGRECLMGHVLLWGNGYAEKSLNAYGDVTALYPITPDRVAPEMRGGQLVYRVKMDNEPDIFLPRERMLHVPGLGFDGFTGYSVVAMARKSLGLGMALETFGSLYFGQGTHPGLILSHPGRVSQQAGDNLKNSFTGAASGLMKAHTVRVLEEGMKIEKIGIPPDDSQFLESRVFHVDEVARWFNLPVHKLKEMTKSSFSNIESEQQSFYTDSILPWLIRLEQNFSMQLLSTSDKEYSGRGRLYFKHNVEGLLRGDSAARAAFYTAMFNVGAMSPNEIREKEDMDPYVGGDVRLVPLNMSTAENAKNPPEPKPQPALPPKKNGEDTDDANDRRMKR